MKLMSRAVLCALLSISLLFAPGMALTSVAASTPVVTKVGSGSGTVRPTVVSIRGKHLKGATAVRFGKKAARIVTRRGATELRVRTPRGAKAGWVHVRVRTKAGWSKKTKRARYLFIAVPQVKRLSRTSGSFTGGDRVVIRGKALKTTRRVTFAKRPARIIKRAKGYVVVRTPLGTLGRAPVRVVTRGGKAKRVLGYTYTAPTQRASARLTPSSGTTASGVQWVSGGLDPATGEMHPWIVSIAPGNAVPEVGTGLIVPPGTPAFPSGLVGTVTDLAVQVDESTRLTVAASDVTSTVSEGHLSYAGPITPAPTAGRLSRTDAPEFESGHSFALTGPTALFCQDDQGQSVAFSSAVTMQVTEQAVDTNLDWGGLFRKPRLSAAYSDKLTLKGKFTVDAAATCKLKPEWSNAQRKIFPLGTSGATISFGPSLEIKFSGKGTYSLEEVTRNTMRAEVELGSLPKVERLSRSVTSKHGGELSFEVELTGGVSAQFGFLDRAGVEAKALLGLSAGVTAGNVQVCVQGKVFLRFGVGLFLDAFVARWESNIATVTFTLAQIDGCSAPAGAVQGTEPEITSSFLPDAVRGSAYEQGLTTAGDRVGTWSLVAGQLPPGTSLDAGSGVVSGVPTTVGTYTATVRFAESDTSTAEADIRIRVVPEAGVGGGDLQIQLRWTGAADLDLHTVDPGDEEIYYMNRESSSGGMLDHDANAGCNGEEDDDNAVENITWPTGQSPDGTYQVWVHTWAECEAPLDWRLTIRRNGRVILDRTGYGDSEVFVVEGSTVTTSERYTRKVRRAEALLPDKR